MRRLQLILGVLAITLLTMLPILAQQGAKGGEWRAYGGDEGSTRYTPLDQITRENIKDLRVAWVWKSDSLLPNPQASSETTPIMVNGVIYFSMDQKRFIVAADAGTGETIWVYRPNEGARFDGAPRKIHRGVSYWTDGRGDERIVFATPGFHLIALNAKTGVPVPGFGTNGIVDMMKDLDLDYKGDPNGRIGNSSPVVISNDVVVVGPAHLRPTKANVKGDVLAYDVRTGKKRWVFHTIPRKGEKGYETWLNGSAEYTGSVGVWGPFSADPELGVVYLNTEAPTNDLWGGARPGDNLYSDCLIAVDIKTGKMLWYFQMIHHDIWDYDAPPHPILLDATIDGQRRKLVVQLSKQAFAYVFDRVTGKPIWPIEERPVPQTDIPGEWSAKTQPHPTKPPAFDRQGITVDDLIDFTPALRAAATQALEGWRIGPVYTPPVVVTTGANAMRGTIQVPGYGGGANWQSGAADPETGFVYVGSNTSPTGIGNRPNANYNAADPDSAEMSQATAGIPTVNGLRLLKPPYGRITGYDMNKGDIAFTIPNGDTPPNIKAALEAAGVKDVAPTGSPSQAHLLVTKNFLFATEGSGGQPILHAYDKKTGAPLWQSNMPAGPATAIPSAYVHQGRPYIIHAARGPQGSGAQLVAWTIAPAPPAGAGGGRGGRGGGGRGAAGAPGAPGAAPAAPAGGGARGGARGGQPAPDGEPQ
ncbi:MAG TPA: PQQ-binding-like beta-propeller repeat protein [Terriglobia bacterium]|nr:PQQ-binding-like beta-propeller repeat protein [Terriglobia bacterium]